MIIINTSEQFTIHIFTDCLQNFKNESEPVDLQALLNSILLLSKNYKFKIRVNRFLPYQKFRGFYLLPFERFGNNFYQFLRVLKYCDLFGYKKIVIVPNFMFFQRNFSVKDISIEIKNSYTDMSNLIYGNFYHPTFNPRVSIDFTYCDYFRDEFLRSFPNLTLDHNDLYIHLRSDDIYFSNEHTNYGQPPVNYFLDVINFKKWNKIYLFSEGFNPMYNFIIKSGAIHKNYSFFEVVSTTLNCYNLAIGKTTFMIALSFLSRHLENFFTFNMPTYKLKPHYNCDPDELYDKYIINNWSITPSKTAVLFLSNCSKWEYFLMKPHIDTSKARFHNDDIWLYWIH